MKLQGEVIDWNDDKGFGFVALNKSGERAFVHIKAFKESSRRPINGERICYELVRDAKDRYQAQQITYVNKPKSTRPQLKRKKSRPFNFGKTVTLLFCAALGIAVFTHKLPFIILALYSVMSLTAFILYALDKSAAQHGRWRTQENTLHLFSLFGGWPGAFFAQATLRHKSSKSSFKKVYWLTVLLNIMGFTWLYSDSGVNFLEPLISPLLNY